jgi:hypothetical protein
MLSIHTRQDLPDAAVADARRLAVLEGADLPREDRLQHQWLLGRLYAETGEAVRAARLFRTVAQAGSGPMSDLARAELRRLATEQFGVEEGP